MIGEAQRNYQGSYIQGDLGGVNSAFDGLQLYLAKIGEIPPIDGFSQQQRFFISWATHQKRYELMFIWKLIFLMRIENSTYFKC